MSQKASGSWALIFLSMCYFLLVGVLCVACDSLGGTQAQQQRQMWWEIKWMQAHLK